MENTEKAEDITKKNVYQRILGIMEDVDYIEKGSAKVNGQYRFVSHDKVTAKIHPFLVKHRVAIVPTVESMEQDGMRTTIKLSVRFINVDDPTDQFTITSFGHGIDGYEKGGVVTVGDKGVGKAYSYAYKYALLKTFNLETGDDPDNYADNEAKAIYTVALTSTEDAIIKEFLQEYQVADGDFASLYIKKYAEHWKKSVASALRDFNDRDKFCADVSKWKAQKAKKAA